MVSPGDTWRCPACGEEIPAEDVVLHDCDAPEEP
jgi:hypothetical protein